MKTVDFTNYAARLAYAYAYNYATPCYESDKSSFYYFLRNDAIQFVREVSIDMSIRHGIDLDITEGVLHTIDDHFERGWGDYFDRTPGNRRIETIADLQHYITSKHRLEALTDTAYWIHQGEAKVLMLLPQSSRVLELKLARLDVMDRIIKESK